MRGGIRIGTIFNIPLFIDPSWFLIVALMTVGYRADYQKVSENLSWFFGLLTALLLFGSVLLHELGHSLTAKAQGIAVNSITLFLFGGVASIERESKDPWSAFSVAIAGPLVSIALGFILMLLALGLGGQDIFFILNNPNSQKIVDLAAEIGVGRALVGAMLGNLALINLILGIFNLIPGLPLDGGQVLKAAIWKITGNRFTGIRWAARSGQAIGYSVIALWIFEWISTGKLFNGFLWPMLLGWFVMNNASSYLQLSRLQEALLNLDVEAAMTRDFRIVDADMTLRQFADEYLLLHEKDSKAVYYAASGGRDRGLVKTDDIRYTERSLWNVETLHKIVEPLKSLVTVDLKAKIPVVIDLLEKEKIRHITVLSPAGSVAGIIDHGDVIRALGRKLNWRVPESFIQQIKADGKFPPDFRLAEISSQL